MSAFFSYAAKNIELRIMIVIGVQTKRRDITISVQYRLTIGIVFAKNERKDEKISTKGETEVQSDEFNKEFFKFDDATENTRKLQLIHN